MKPSKMYIQKIGGGDLDCKILTWGASKVSRRGGNSCGPRLLSKLNPPEGGASRRHNITACCTTPTLPKPILASWSLTGRSLTEKRNCSVTQLAQRSPGALHVFNLCFNHGSWRLAVGGWRRLAVGGGCWWLAAGGVL